MTNTRIVLAMTGLIILASCSSAAPQSSSAPTLLPAPSRTPSATATRRPTPTVTLAASRLPLSGEIEPGRYFIDEGFISPVTFSFTMPAGWVAENLGQTISKHPYGPAGHVSWSVAIVDRLYADPCGPDGTIEVGPTSDDLAAALVGLPRVVTSGPTDITLGGLPGKRVDLEIPPDLDVSECDPPIGLQIWLDRSGNKYLVVIREGPTRVHAVDVQGSRFVITRDYNRTAAPQDVAEFEAIMASIKFEP